MNEDLVKTIEDGEADLVYTFAGSVAHVKLFGHAWTLCQRWPDVTGEFMGTGTQSEREKARRLPLCKRCEQRVNLLPYFKSLQYNDEPAE